MLAAEVLRLSPSYLENLGVVESAFIERVRAADRSGDDRVTTRDVLLSMDNPDQFYATLEVLEDWRTKVSKDIARRLFSLDPERWSSLGVATGDPPGDLGEGGGGLPPPGGSGSPGATGTGGNANFPGPHDGYVSYSGYWLERWNVSPAPEAALYDQYAWDMDVATIDKNIASGVQADGLDEGWVIVNNDDDDYDSGDTATDAGQTDAFGNPVVAAWEDDFLPFVIRKRVPIGNPAQPFNAVFRLVFGVDTNIRVWRQLTAATETTPATWQQIHNMQTIGYVDYDHLLFVEAIGILDMTQQMFDQIELFVQPVDAMGVPTIQAQRPVDRLKIWTSYISGPTAVPWGGIYTYTAIGGKLPNMGWETPVQGSKVAGTEMYLSMGPVPSMRVNVLWDGAKPTMGAAVFRPDTGYTWKREVAVVKVSTVSAVLAERWKVWQRVAIPGFEEQLPEDLRQLDTLRTVPPTDGYEGQQAVVAIVELAIEQPIDKGIGRGREYITAGFIQNWIPLSCEGIFDDGTRRWARRHDLPYNQTFLDADPGEVWYDPTGESYNDAAGLDGVASCGKGQGVYTEVINMGDSPASVPTDTLQHRFSGMLANPLTDVNYFNVDESFEIHIAARTSQASGYWSQYHAAWLVCGDGVVAPGTHLWTSDNEVLSIQVGTFAPSAAGFAPVTTGPTANEVGDAAGYINVTLSGG